MAYANKGYTTLFSEKCVVIQMICEVLKQLILQLCKQM